MILAHERIGLEPMGRFMRDSDARFIERHSHIADSRLVFNCLWPWQLGGGEGMCKTLSIFNSISGELLHGMLCLAHLPENI
jgi:hypothetical protein